jgi:ribosomal protein S18 acetylase RimI-like enzyme
MDGLTIHKTTREKAQEISECGSRNLPIYLYPDEIIYILGYPKYYGVFHVQNENQKIIGYAICQTIDGNNKMYISSLCVDTEYRRRGIGKVLIDECKKEFKDRKNMRLHVHTENIGAIELYKKCGFIIEKTIPNYYGGVYRDAKTQDAYVMKCKLNQTGKSIFCWKSK